MMIILVINWEEGKKYNKSFTLHTIFLKRPVDAQCETSVGKSFAADSASRVCSQKEVTQLVMVAKTCYYLYVSVAVFDAVAQLMA